MPGTGSPAATRVASFACVDSAIYVALALGAQECVPPAVRDGTFGWLVIGVIKQRE